MAIPIQVPTVGAALQRLFRLQGRVKPALEEFILPVVKIADLSRSEPPPLTRGATARFFRAAVALEFGTFRFEIPGEMIAHVRALYLTPNGSAGSFRFHFGSTIPAPSGTAQKSFTDLRLLQLGQSPAGVLTFGTQVAVLTPLQFQVAAEDLLTYKLEPDSWIVGSGVPGVFSFLEGQFSVLNTAINVSMLWDEYPIV